MKELNTADYINKPFWTRSEVAHFMNKKVKTLTKYKTLGLTFSRVGMINKQTFLTWLNEQ